MIHTLSGHHARKNARRPQANGQVQKPLGLRLGPASREDAVCPASMKPA